MDKPAKLKPSFAGVKLPFEKCIVNNSMCQLSEIFLPMNTFSPNTKRLSTHLSRLSRIYGPMPIPKYQSLYCKSAVSTEIPIEKKLSVFHHIMEDRYDRT